MQVITSENPSMTSRYGQSWGKEKWDRHSVDRVRKGTVAKGSLFEEGV